MVALLPVAFAALSVIFGGETPAQPAGAPTPTGETSRVPAALVDAAAPLSTATPLAAASPADASAPAARPDGGQTDERLTVDAVVAGDYATAALRYERLARTNPEPAFPEAARILRAKLDGGAR